MASRGWKIKFWSVKFICGIDNFNQNRRIVFYLHKIFGLGFFYPINFETVTQVILFFIILYFLEFKRHVVLSFLLRE